MNDPTAAIQKKFARCRKAVLDATKAGAEEYANGAYRARPLVDAHFTAGNQQRYGWAPLSTEYFRWKQGLIPKRAIKAGRFRGSKLDPNAEHQTVNEHTTGIGHGTNLPMLVLSGDLRKAVGSRTHSVAAAGDQVVVTFRGLPKYAEYHQTGTGKMPKRSPVDPNAEDRALVLAAMRRFLDRAFGSSGARTGMPWETAT